MRAAGEQIRHVHLDLGGKAPVIVFDDADINAVAETIRYGSFFNAGQDCAQPCRVMAQDGVYDKLVAAIEAQVKEILVGTQREEGTEMGPIVSTAQRERVAAFVNRASGACEVVTGGAAGDREGFFYQPTVLANVANDAEVATHEVLGQWLRCRAFPMRKTL
ncbi:aldehyde dehydrogenase family protein [Shimia sp. SDUM112013]